MNREKLITILKEILEKAKEIIKNGGKSETSCCF